MKRRLLSLFLAMCLVLGMLPASAYAADIPAETNILGITSVTEFIPGEEIEFSLWGMSCGPVPSYIATVPEGTKTVTLTFKSGTYPTPYDDYYTGELSLSGAWVTYNEEDGAYSGTGASHYPTAVDGTHSIELDVADMITNGRYYCAYDAGNNPIYLLAFEYAEDGDSGEDTPTTSDAPFLNIKINGEEVAAENIVLKNPAFQMGDIDDGDGWDLIHEAPYYVVTVPCGTTTVDVTYPGEPVLAYNTENNKAHGYATVIDDVDAVSGATVKGKNNFADYTKNSDNTQTVAMPVTGYALDENGEGMAITLEDGSTFAAICFFSFKYDGEKHVYDAGKVTTEPGCETEGVKTFTCSCGDSYTEPVDAVGHNYQDGVCGNCGEADPDYVVPGGAEIPDGAPFTALTTDAGEVTAFADMGTVDYTGYSTYYGVPYYHVTIPAGATQVYVTHPSAENPFADASYGSAYGYYAETSGWTGSGVSFTFEEAEDGFVIALPLSCASTDWSTGETVEMSFVADEDGYVGYAVAVERNDYTPICFFTFEFAEADPGEHIHDYGDGIVTTEPTCTEAGEKTFTCPGCGDSYNEEIPATGHSYDEGVVTTDPTCTEAGVKTYTCSGCGTTKTESVAALGHSYNAGEITTDPTCTDAGVKTFTCSGCGATKTESVAALGHDYQNGKCANCGDVCPAQDENGIFQIGTYEELLWFAEAVNGGNTAIKGVLIADITVAADWPGIGNYSNKFAGSFDGQNYTVTLSGGTWGLFGYTMGTHNNHNLKDAAIIQNVILEGTVQNSALIQNAGYTHISGCINRADVTGGNSNVAGIVGTVSGSSKYGQTYSDVLIQNCGNEGDIQGGDYVGGILGYTQANTRLDGCCNTGTISGDASVGGLVGYMQGSTGSGSIKNSYNMGAVQGSSEVGGIVGTQYNGVSIANCYNAGTSTYAISGRVYNKTASASNVYYRSDLSTYGEPEYFQGSTGASNGFNTTVRGVAKCSGDMGSAEFAALLGDAFKESCGGAVLVWQEAKPHDLIDGVCYECKAGHTEKAKFNVIKSTGDGYEIVGDTIVNEGSDYTFEVIVLDGYYATDSFAVYANGAVLTPVDGIYTVEQPTGHFYVTVTGVKELEGILPVSMPGAGNGYRVVPCEGYGTTVESGKEFKFLVTFANGFQAGEDFTVQVNGQTVKPDAEGVYTVENVTQKLTITVDGVDIIPSGNTVTVDLGITKGEKEFLFSEETGDIMLDKQLEISYFDIGLYGLEKYYYNPYCYVDESGNVRGQQQGGNRETAYDVVTAIHAFIYMTEVYYLGLDKDVVGTGYSDTIDSDQDGISDFDEAVSWTQGPGSSFMNLWGLGSNLNYHINYKYPTAYSGWGATSDQIRMYEGDVLSLHLIEGSASGSAFGFFAVNDEDHTYDGTELRDRATVKQGEKIKLNLYWGDQGENYTTSFLTGPNKNLYWVEAGDEQVDVRQWSRDNFGAMTAQTLITDENGAITVDTTGLEPGTYYIAAEGGFTQGSGKPGEDGFVSRGAEAGPAYFVLTVEEADVQLGDVTGDSAIDTEDAGVIIDFYYGVIDLTAEQRMAADVNGDGIVDTEDAGLLIDYYYGLVDSLT
ncbi:MAG: dockerin type I repeat-containing protein [Oscillospiraceae bacterium]|nr:dockerin type I repeat-containing protein [Oscillospiraceae bacterium]